MKTLLIIAKESGLAAAVGAAVEGERYRIIAHEEVFHAEAVLTQGIIDGCLLDAELTDIQPIRIIKQIRRLAPQCPILIYTANTQWEWEEEAYLLGVDHILAKPVRSRLLESLLERMWHSQTPPPAAFTPAIVREPPMADAPREPEHALKVLRDFSAILTHSLSADSLLKQFLLLMREILGVNRAAIFLRQPVCPGGSIGGRTEDLLLRPACALGLSQELLDHLVLSPEHGIGRYVYRSGRILKNGSDEARFDLVAQKEFALLGAQVAIPILDRESVVGVAIFDGRLTGEFFANEELGLIFHLLEGVGLAIKNSWLYDQLVASHEMMTDILNDMASGCVVVDRQLKVVHANPAARRHFPSAKNRAGSLEFSDLPQEIASKLFETLRSGVSQSPFNYRPIAKSETVLQIHVMAFTSRNSITANAALLVVDDITQAERVHQLELETSNLRLTKAIASRLAHEIGNSMVPVMTYQGLTERKGLDTAAYATLASASNDGLRRILRLTRQAQLLADDAVSATGTRTVEEIVGAAIKDAEQHAGKNAVKIQASGDKDAGALKVRSDGDKLPHALAEVVLNALQAAAAEHPVTVRWVAEKRLDGLMVCVEVEDSGGGFSAAARERATDPFFSTRTVGTGLGLTVARRIIELHGGKISFTPLPTDESTVVRIYLPSEPADGAV